MTSYKTLYQEMRAQHAAALLELERIGQVVDLAGIARHMKVDRLTPQQWRQRGLLPPVDFPEIKEPLWYVSTIKEKFIADSRVPRVWYDDPGDAAEVSAEDIPIPV